jgi:hypothetical protein
VKAERVEHLQNEILVESLEIVMQMLYPYISKQNISYQKIYD